MNKPIQAQTVPYAIEFDDRYYKELKAKKPKSDQERFDLWRAVHPMATTVNPKKTVEPTKAAPVLATPAKVAPVTTIQVTQDGNLDELIFPDDETIATPKNSAARMKRKAKKLLKKK